MEWLIVLGVLIAAILLFTLAVTVYFFFHAVCRNDKYTVDAALARMRNKVPPEHFALIKKGAEGFIAAPRKDVFIISRDGLKLHGFFIEQPAPTAARGTIILVHGWHSCWDLDFSGSAPFLHKEGCSLLLIDQRCHGESGGDLISYGVKEKDDVLLWLEWVERTHPGLPVYLCGVSMGAATVLMVAGESLSGRIRGVIADCGYSSPTPVIKGTLTHTLGKWGAPTYMAIDLNCRRRGGFSLSESSPAQALKKNTDIPCLFFHGDADPLVPWTMSLENYRACRAPKELVVVHGAAHAMSYIVEPGLYREKLCAFFEANDPPPTPKRRRFGRRKENAS